MFVKVKYYHFMDDSQDCLINEDWDSSTKVIIVIEKKFSNQDILVMLSNLLEKGLNLTHSQYQIIEYNNEPYSLGKKIKFGHQSLVISFGIAFHQLGFKIETAPYFLYKLSDTHILYVDSVDKILSDKVNKAKLWNLIKHLEGSL